MKLNRYALASATLLAMTLVACGEQGAQQTSHRTAAPADSGDAIPADQSTEYDVSLSLADAGTALSLADVDALQTVFQVQCDGIKTQTVNQAFFTLIGERTNCLAKLIQFTVGTGEVFIADAPFKTYMPPETATFKGSAGHAVEVAVVTQLPPIVKAASAVLYRVKELRKGADRRIATNQISFAIDGALAPSLKVLSQDYDYEKLTVTFECEERVSGNTLADGNCAGDNLGGMRFLAEPLIEKVDLSFLSLELMRKLIAGPGVVPVKTLGATFLKPGEGGTANGGIRFAFIPKSAGTRNPNGLPGGYLLTLSPAATDSFLVTRLTFDF